MEYPLPNYGYHSVYKKFYEIDIELTRRCHNNCVFCNFAKNGHGQETMNINDLTYILELFPEFSGIVGFGTGEVLMLDDLPSLIYLVKSYWPSCQLSITTTFNIYRGYDYIYKLFSSGLDKMIISCYGYTSNDYTKIHGSKYFGSLVKNIRLLKGLPDKFINKIVFRSFNKPQILFNNFSEEKFAKFVSLCTKCGISKFDKTSYFKWNANKPINGDALWELPSPCDVVWGYKSGGLFINYNLDIVPCCFMRDKMNFGNLRNMSLKEIFNSESYKYFYQQWWQMRPQNIPICNTCQMYKASAARDELARMAAWQARELHGKKVIFWGAGEAYRAYKSFFADCEPVAILVDGVEEGTNIDGIPVHSPEQFLPTFAEPLPLVIFAMQEASPKILRTLKENYPFYRPSKVVICPANAHIEAPVEPFFQD